MGMGGTGLLITPTVFTARPEQMTDGKPYCWYCGDSLDGRYDLVEYDSDRFAYHKACLEEDTHYVQGTESAESRHGRTDR